MGGVTRHRMGQVLRSLMHRIPGSLGWTTPRPHRPGADLPRTPGPRRSRTNPRSLERRARHRAPTLRRRHRSRPRGPLAPGHRQPTEPPSRHHRPRRITHRRGSPFTRPRAVRPAAHVTLFRRLPLPRETLRHSPGRPRSCWSTGESAARTSSSSSVAPRLQARARSPAAIPPVLFQRLGGTRPQRQAPNRAVRVRVCRRRGHLPSRCRTHTHAPFFSSNLDMLASCGVLGTSWRLPLPNPPDRLALTSLAQFQNAPPVRDQHFL